MHRTGLSYLASLFSRLRVCSSSAKLVPALTLIIVASCAYQTAHAPTNKQSDMMQKEQIPLVVADPLDLPLITNINTNVLSDYEGCDTNLHWPGSKSGPTIGRGIDLGNNSKKTIAVFFKTIVTDSVLKLLQSASGIRGAYAKAWVAKHPEIHISRKQADQAFHRTTRLMWNIVLQKHGHWIDTLDPNVKGIVLSVAYNYGAHSPVIASLVREYKLNGLTGMSDQLEHMAEITDHEALKKRRYREREVIGLVATSKQGDALAYFD